MAQGKKVNTVSIAHGLGEPVALQLGLRLWDVRFEKEGGDWFLRYFIDKPGGVNIDDCERFSRQVETSLDEADPIPQRYYLEVSSPGVERELKKEWHFMENIGKRVNAKTIRALDGQRSFSGKLMQYEDGTIKLELVEGGEVSIAQEQLAYVRIHGDFDFGG